MRKISVLLGAALILALLSASYIIYDYMQAGSVSFGARGANWEFMNYDSNASNYSPQDQINVHTAGSLKFAWIFPFPSVTGVPGLNQSGSGSITPPLVVQGVVYLQTNFLRVYALDANSGVVLWSYDPSLNTSGLSLGPLIGHQHGINYYGGKIWVRLPDCSIVALDALTGTPSFKIPRICAGVPGNAGLYDTDGTAPVFAGNILITGASVSDSTDAGRGFVAGYNISTGQMLWRWFVVPPAGGDPRWDTEDLVQLGNGSTVNYGTPVGNVAPYGGDWGTMGLAASRTLVGAGVGWGQYAVDSNRGVVYVGTSQSSPDANATFRPGPNLYTDSIVALNATSGKLLWYYQTTPHDLADFDCGWNVVLGTSAINGTNQEIVYKACKNGYLYALNAITGKLLWYFDPPGVARQNTPNANYVVTGKYNSTLRWANDPSNQTFLQCPGLNGGIEADIAQAYGKVYVAAYNFCTEGQATSVGTPSSSNFGITNVQYLAEQANTTIYAVDSSTGKLDWSFFIPHVPYRGWLTASGGLIFAGSLDGNIYMLDASSGALVSKLYVGTSLYTSPTIGADSSGNMMLFQVLGSTSRNAFGENVPGGLLAFGLSSSTANVFYSLEFYLAAIILGISLGCATILAVASRRKY